MSNYTPPYTISNRMLELISTISEKVGRITSLRELDNRPHLRKNNRIRSIHSSLRIEANSLSMNEVRDIINGHIVIGEQKEIQEVKNAYKAYEQLDTINPFNLTELKRLHSVMTAGVVGESGTFRKGSEGVFKGDRCIFIAPPADMVPTLMNDLFSWMKKNDGLVHPLILAAVFHYEFVYIHPFADGNGRMARFWHTAIISRWRNIFEYIPLESQIEKYQDEYYDAINRCHNAGNSDIFIEFMLTMIDHVLDEVIAQVNRENSEITEFVRKLLEVMEFDVPYTSNALLAALNLKSKETLRKNYIDPALELKLIQMTIPEKPRSKNQRYVKH